VGATKTSGASLGTISTAKKLEKAGGIPVGALTLESDGVGVVAASSR